MESLFNVGLVQSQLTARKTPPIPDILIAGRQQGLNHPFAPPANPR
jgi:hypothetical protein